LLPVGALQRLIWLAWKRLCQTRTDEGRLGLNTGAGKPTVFPKRVCWVWVWFPFLAHHGTPLPILRYCGYVRVNYNKVILNFIVCFSYFFFQCFFSKFIMSCCDGTKYGSVSRMYILAFNHQLALSSYSQSHLTSETGKLYFYISKTDQ
jgi:hypothetical protein